MSFLPVKVTQPAEAQTSHSNCLHKVVDGSQIQFHRSWVSFHTIPWPMAVFMLSSQDIGTYGPCTLTACPSSTWHQHRMMRPLLISLLASKHHYLLRTNQQWAQIPPNMGVLTFVTPKYLFCIAEYCNTAERRKNFASVSCFISLKGVWYCRVYCKQHLHQKAVLWVSGCSCHGSGWDVVGWALPSWICPVLVQPLKSLATAMSAVSKCHQTFVFLKNHGHFHPLLLQGFPFLLCRWSKYSFICVLTVREHL